MNRRIQTNLKKYWSVNYRGLYKVIKRIFLGTVARGSFGLFLFLCRASGIDIKSDDALRVTILQQKPFEILDSGL